MSSSFFYLPHEYLYNMYTLTKLYKLLIKAYEKFTISIFLQLKEPRKREKQVFNTKMLKTLKTYPQHAETTFMEKSKKIRKNGTTYRVFSKIKPYFSVISDFIFTDCIMF